jgi:hypothetical protein
MARQQVQFLAFNRGIVSPYALARIDLKRMQYSAEIMTNWMPRVFGPMMLRPGLGYLGITTKDNGVAVPIPFIRATADAQWLEAGDSYLRPIINLAPITRPAVSTTITNGDFTVDLTGWTSADQAGAVSAHDLGSQMGLTGTGTNDAIRYQVIAISAPDQAKEHGIRIVVTRGPVMLRIGTGIGLDDLQRETALGQGTHSLGITPNAASICIYFFNRQDRKVDVDSVAIEAAGEMTLPASWTLADLPLLRWAQSADVMYICDGTHAQLKIERRAENSWSLVSYLPEDGPYRLINFAPTTITPSAIKGDITLAASSPIFNAGHVGALFRFASLGQDVISILAGVDQFSDTVRTTGVGLSRNWTVIVSGIGTNVLKLQRSPEPDGGFVNVGTITANGTYTENDGLDNQIIYHRILMSVYNGGSTTVELIFSGGSINGDVRITSVTDNQNAGATVLNSLGGVTPTTTWYEGAWSDFRGWPTAPVLHEDRLWWLGLGSYWGSVTDGYEDFDDTTLGNSAPISRTIGRGPVDWVNWGLSLQRLVVGTDGTLISARSDSLDTPLTPDNFNLKFPITLGAARIAPVNADDLGYFVHRNLVRLYELAFDTSNYIKLDYGAEDMMAICPEVCNPGIVKILVQRQPDKRIHAILSDGTVAVMVGDKLEGVNAWVKIETPQLGGFVEDGVILPDGGFEDAVYYIVRRIADDRTVYRNYEKFAEESECVGGTLNKQADCFVTFAYGAPTTVITGLPAIFENHNVIVWADGKDFSPGPDPIPGVVQHKFLVTGGQITLPSAVSSGVVGLAYQAQFKGVKLAYAAQMGSAISQTQIVAGLGLMLADTHSHGVLYGPDFDQLDNLPAMEEEAEVLYDYVWGPANGEPAYDKRQFSFIGEFTADARLCLVATAPRPARVLAAIVTVKTNEG